MKGRYKRIGTLLALLVGMLSCSLPTKLADQTRVHIVSSETPLAGINERLNQPKIPSKNVVSLEQYAREEWPLNKGSEHEPPCLCLAMSGGGIRSASFDLGVLSGLAEIPQGRQDKLLDNLDVVSAVSGSSYIASWYFLQHQRKPTSQSEAQFRAELFDTTSSASADTGYQKYLAENSDIFPHKLGFAASVLDVIASPANLLANGVFDWRLQTSPGEAIYKERLNSTFQTSPDGKQDLNLTFPQLAELIKAQHLPILIINATAMIEDDPNHYASKMRNSDFEFTPFHYGSDAFLQEIVHGAGTSPQYSYAFPQYEDGSPMSIKDAVEASGAAVDSNYLVAGPMQTLLFSAFNLDWDVYVSNPGVSGQDRALHNLLPFPFYLLYRDLHDSKGVSIRLSDGGFSDNLGGFAVIRRLCDRIIIVDAEYDPAYTFGSYFKLKDAVLAEFGADLSVKEIDDLPRCDNVSSGQCLQDGRFNRIHPVMKGSVSSFPWPTGQKSLQVVYLKLWVDDDELRRYSYPTTVSNMWKKSKLQSKDKCGPDSKPTNCGQFPQDPTSDQDFDSDRFSAYRDLGHAIVMDHQGEIMDALGLPHY
jgi:hypothetical protein